MRVLLSLVMALLLVGLTSVDPLVCPDGCADEPVGQAPSAPVAPAGGLCLFCVGVSLDVPPPAAAPAARIAVAPRAVVGGTRAPHLPRIEHPPRLA